jgi:RNA polymerase sigma-70 factor (ECF subfamily)
MAGAEGLFTAHRDRVLRYLARMVGHPDARDLTQEVFLRVTRTPVPGDTDEAQRAWIFRIARNLALNHLRDRRRHGTSVAIKDRSGPPNQELALTLQRALGRLTPLDREVFLLREASGLRYDEIADACGLSEDAVRSRLHRIRQQLRLDLEGMLSNLRTTGVKLYDRD